MRKKIITLIALALCLSGIFTSTALADSSKVVTLGANLSDSQKETMYQYFGVNKDEVEVIEVNNTEERQYLEGIASEETIGTRTYSCAYIEPTTSGGIQVKTANLTWVTSNMIASTLTTAGITNCNVVAACPIEVSGTGALTGILKAYEVASDNKLDEEKKQLATDELIETGELGDAIGKDEAVQLISEIKGEVIETQTIEPEEIEKIVTEHAENANVTLTDEQIAQITALMGKIAAQDYNYDELKTTLDRIENNIGDYLNNASDEQKSFFTKILDSIKQLWDNIVNFFTGSKDEPEPEISTENNILDNTNDNILGDNVVTDNTSTTAATENQMNQETESDSESIDNTEAVID